MTVEFEALVGHLYMVGGRAISAPPPGALVEVAPKKAARGREGDTFFALVLPSGDATAPTAFYEQMAQLGAEKYFGSTGSVTNGLRTVFSVLNQNLHEHNQTGKRHYEANMLCAVLRESDLIVARVGSGVTVLRQEAETLTFPPNLSDDEAVFGPPLGVQPVPDVKMTRYTVGSSTRLLLADSNLAELNLDKITSALVVQDIAEVLVALKGLVTTQITLMAVEFVPPDVPVPVPVQEGESTAKIAAGAKAPAAEAVAESAPLKPEANSHKQRGRKRDTPNPVQVRAQLGVGEAALRASRGLNFLNRMLDHFFPSPQEGGRKWLASPLATAAVVLIPLAVVLLVVVLWLGGTGESEFELCVKEVNSRSELARSIASSDVRKTIDAWTLTLTKIDECDRLRPGDVNLAAIKREGQNIIDRLNAISRRETQLIATFPNASLTRVVLQGQDLYVLDNANDQVYRVTLSDDGLRATSQPPIPSMRRSALVDQFTLGDLIDITFSTDENKIVALDRDGLVVKCSPRFTQTCEAQRLLAVENWVSPKAIKVWQGRLYVLDTGANQIWRYDPSGGVYAVAPSEYFTGQARPTLTTATDFGIDENGSLFVLLADGVIGKFRGGQAQNFGYSGFPEGQPLNNAVSFYLNNSPISQAIFIVSQTNRTIYETTQAGTFQRSYRAFDEDQFALVASAVVSTSQQLIYAVSGNAVLMFRKE